MKRQIFVGMLFIFFLLNISSVQADWTPDENELAPSKDTYLSISGVLSEPAVNFGGAESIYVGDGLKGICMGLIAFDLSSISDDANSLTFTSTCVSYGDATWTLHVSVILNANWNELQITTVENNLDILNIYSENSANVSDLTITGSTDEISLNLTDFLDESAITLVFSPDVSIDATWLTMSSKENSYLSSYSNPPHLTFEVPKNSDDSDSSNSSIGVIMGILVVGIIVVIVVLRKRKPKKA
ncbi:MAG: hypothetical protein ACTSWC_05695 [Promethearchaeota archaeon]